MEITIKLDMFERKFLLFIASRNGEVDMDHNGLTKEAVTKLDSLDNKGAINRFKVIGTSNTYQYKLTPIGINLVGMIEES